MKKSVVFLTAALALLSSQSFATPVLSDNFNSYPNGNLTNGTTWFQTGAPGATPVQVNGGVVTIGSSGQDVYSPFSSPVTLADGQSLYFGLTLNVSAAQATGDYFLHFTPNAGNGSLFYDRAFVQSTSGGYLLGLQGTSGTGATVTYGTQVLSFGTSYNFVLAYNYFSATTNSAIDSIYINPTDPAVANNTAYLTAAWQGNADTNQIGAVNFRQGSAGSAPTLTVDNLVVSQTFGDTVPAPEPSTIALAAMGGAACLAAFRRRR